jgi:hypothetical protein
VDLAEEAVALLDQLSGPRLRVRALSELARCQWLAGSQRTAIRTADRAIAMADEFGLESPLQAHGYRGLARAEVGERDGIDEADEAVEALIAGGAGRLAANMMNNLALMRWVIHGPAQTLIAMDQAISFAQQRNLHALAELVRSNSAEILADRGRIDEAVSIWLDHAAEARRLGDTFDLVDASTCLAYIMSERGELDAALAYAATAASSVDEVESLDLRILHARLAIVWLLGGDAERARRTLSDVAALDESRNSLFYCLALPVAMRTAVALGDLGLARRLIDGINPSYDMHVASAASARAALVEVTDGSRDALPLYADAAQRMRAMGHIRELAFSLLGQGRCLVHQGEPAATDVLREAQTLFASFGFAPRVAEVQNLMDEVATGAV